MAGVTRWVPALLLLGTLACGGQTTDETAGDGGPLDGTGGMSRGPPLDSSSSESGESGSDTSLDRGSGSGEDSGAPPLDAGVDPGLSAPSCHTPGPGLTDCGPARENCCTSPLVPGGTFYRSYDGVTYTDNSHPATVSTFRLDRYEVTVGRYRQFLNAVWAGWTPAPGSGKHTYLNGGLGLAATGGGYESGWDASWTSDFVQSTASYNYSTSGQTWTPTPGAQEHYAMADSGWPEACAFCIWDGGFLPSEAEWNYAAAGGDEQRAYPWSQPASATAIDCSYANYDYGTYAMPMWCTPTHAGANDVGFESPKGDGLWGHADLGGNVEEWVLDSYGGYNDPCVDCANLSPPDAGSGFVARGGAFASLAAGVLVSWRMNFYSSLQSAIDTGFRCARAP